MEAESPPGETTQVSAHTDNPTVTNGNLLRPQPTISSANDSPSGSFAPPTESTALGLDLYQTPHYSLSHSGKLGATGGVGVGLGST